MEVGVLGPLVVGACGVPGAAKERALLELLALRAPRAVPDAALVEGLWGDAPPDTAAGTLRTLVSRLRRRVPGLPIERAGGGYRLLVDPAAVDVHHFEHLAASGRAAYASGDHHAARARLAAARALWRGSPLGDVTGATSAAEIVRLEQLLLDVEDDLLAAQLACGDAGVLVAEVEAAVAAQPLRERRWAQLMTVLYRDGQRTEALRAFRRARAVLGDVAGLEPGPELVALERAVLADDPRLRLRPTSVSESESTLPVWTTTLIGRSEQRARLARRLETVHTLTLTGFGGVGKTRLAADVAGSLRDRYDGRVHFVDLAPMGASSPLADAVATSFGADAAPDRSPVDLLVAWLRGGPSLLVLDNCEHLVDQAAPLVRTLVQRAPELRVLTTSRVPLAIDGEVVERVDPLGVPPPDAVDAAVIQTFPAVQLFVERAQAVDPGFALDDDAAAVVGAICRRLDGIPLAIELAAALTDVLGPAQIADRLVDGTAILRTARRDANDRHASLDVVLASSTRLLDPLARRLLDRLAVFRSPTTLDVLETVVTDEDLPASAVLDAVGSLARRALVVTSSGGSRRQYRLLETVRAYAWQRLVERGELDAWRTRHLAWVLDVLHDAAAGWARDVATWHRRIDDIAEDVEHALEWAARTPQDAEAAMRSVVGIFSYWGTRRTVGARWCRSLALAATTFEPARRVEALWNACFLMGGVDLRAADDIAEEARELAARSPNDAAADALATLATMACAVFRGDRLAIRRAYGCAAPRLDGMPRLFADYFDVWALSLEDDHERAHAAMAPLLERVHALGDEHIFSGFLGEAADLALAAAVDEVEARRQAEHALEIARRVPCPLCESKALTSLVLATPGMHADEAIALTRHAVRRADETGLPFAVLVAMPGLEAALHAAGDPVEALRLAAATESLRRRTGHCHLLPARRLLHERTLREARRVLGPDTSRQVWEAGTRLGYRELVEASSGARDLRPWTGGGRRETMVR